MRLGAGEVDLAVEERARPIALILNPASRASVPAGRVLERWPGGFCAAIETRPDSSTPERVAEIVSRADPAIVVAAGGDGTVSDVVEGILMADRSSRPALGILPTGTANNAARSLGLRSIRSRDGGAALEIAMSALLAGDERTIDLGRVGGRHFVSAFAVGFDADVLFTRNRLRGRSRLARRFEGYPLYLWSAAVNAFSDHHGAAVRLFLDGAKHEAYAYNLLFTNTPLYGGGFRVDDNAAAEDGFLDLHVFEGPRDYLRRLPAAWRRQRRHSRGRVFPPSDGLRVRQATIELDVPVRCQLDGEELGREASLEVRIVPKAIRVRVPHLPARGRS
jgi:diacylglycerol kinase family enzyme